MRVIGVDSDPNSIGFNFCDESYVVPNANQKTFLKKIIQICNKEKPNVILPSIEEEIIKLSKNRKIFEEKNILILSPEFNISKICADKLQTREKFLAHKIPTYGIFSNNTHFPCIIKPQFGRGGKDVFKVNNSEEL